MLKKLNYLLYRLFNDLTFFFLRRYCKTSKLNKNDAYLFDFTHSSTHLGDRLFYFPLIYYLIKNNFKVYFEKKDRISPEIFLALYNKQINCLEKKKNSQAALIFPKYSLLAKVKDAFIHKCHIFSPSSLSDNNLIEQLFEAFGIDKRCLAFSLPKKIPVKRQKKIILLSNYIDSGFFRKWFVEEEKLFRECKKFKKLGYEIWHIGSEMDKKGDRRDYNFVDKDLRGCLSLTELINEIKNNSVTIVSFDNFIMHLGNIYNRNCKILFRGRFLKKNRDYHFRCVNSCLSNNKNTINYL